MVEPQETSAKKKMVNKHISLHESILEGSKDVHGEDVRIA